MKSDINLLPSGLKQRSKLSLSLLLWVVLVNSALAGLLLGQYWRPTQAQLAQQQLEQKQIAELQSQLQQQRWLLGQQQTSRAQVGRQTNQGTKALPPALSPNQAQQAEQLLLAMLNASQISWRRIRADNNFQSWQLEGITDLPSGFWQLHDQYQQQAGLDWQRLELQQRAEGWYFYLQGDIRP